VGPGDLLSIYVSGVTAFDQSTRISNSGRIHVPYVGIILVAGLTTVEMEVEIARLIEERELIKVPAVRVRVEDARAQPVYVIGAVSLPGQFVITTEMYLLDLLGKAGGLQPAADAKAFVYRQTITQPHVDVRLVDWTTVPPVEPPEAMSAKHKPLQPETIEIDLEALSAGSRPELNLRLQSGDVLYVPTRRARNFFVVGDVITPGTYTLPRYGTITAAQALIYAGGPMPTAKTSKGFIMRHDEKGERQTLEFDFREILQGKEPDIVVQTDDIIFIPTSNVRTIGIGLLNLMPRLLQQFLIF
jgi:polysaccharide export outer membrane protein